MKTLKVAKCITLYDITSIASNQYVAKESIEQKVMQLQNRVDLNVFLVGWCLFCGVVLLL